MSRARHRQFVPCRSVQLRATQSLASGSRHGPCARSTEPHSRASPRRRHPAPRPCPPRPSRRTRRRRSRPGLRRLPASLSVSTYDTVQDAGDTDAATGRDAGQVGSRGRVAGGAGVVVAEVPGSPRSRPRPRGRRRPDRLPRRSGCGGSRWRRSRMSGVTSSRQSGSLTGPAAKLGACERTSEKTVSIEASTTRKARGNERGELEPGAMDARATERCRSAGMSHAAVLPR